MIANWLMKLSTILIKYSPIPVANRNDENRPTNTRVFMALSLVHMNFSQIAFAKGSINANNAPNPPMNSTRKNAGPIILDQEPITLNTLGKTTNINENPSLTRLVIGMFFPSAICPNNANMRTDINISNIRLKSTISQALSTRLTSSGRYDEYVLAIPYANP